MENGVYFGEWVQRGPTVRVRSSYISKHDETRRPSTARSTAGVNR